MLRPGMTLCGKQGEMRESRLRRSLWSLPPAIGVLLGCLYSFFSQVNHFAVTDDYRLVFQAQSLRPFLLEGHAGLEARTGRVIPGLFFKIIWFGVRDVSDLWYVRFVGVLLVGVTAASFLVWCCYKVRPLSRTSATVVSVAGFLVMLLPGVSATTTWATKTAHLLAAPLGMLAGIIATQSHMTWRRWSVVALLIFMSVFSYQHFAMLATLPVAVSLALDSGTPKTAGRFSRLLFVMGMALAALVSNVLFVRFVESGVLDRISDRSLANRFKEVIDVGVKGTHIFVNKSVVLLILSALFVTTFVAISLRINSGLWRLLLAVLVAASCSIILTFGADGDSSYRMILPSQLTIWLGLGALTTVAANSARQATSRVRLLLLPVFLCAALPAAIEARHVIRNDISIPNRDDWSRIRCHVRHVSSMNKVDEVVIRLIPIELTGPNAVRSEIGLVAGHIEWLLRDQWLLALSLTPDAASLENVPLRVIDSGNQLPAETAGSYVIDLRQSCSESRDAT